MNSQRAYLSQGLRNCLHKILVRVFVYLAMWDTLFLAVHSGEHSDHASDRPIILQIPVPRIFSSSTSTAQTPHRFVLVGVS